MRDEDEMRAKMAAFDRLPKAVRDAWNYHGKKAAEQVKNGLLLIEIEDDYPKVEANETYGRKRESAAAKAAREEGAARRIIGQIGKTLTYRRRKARRGA